MKRLLQLALVALLGFFAGFGSDEALHAFRTSKSAREEREAFQMRLRCKRAADEFVKKESADGTFIDLARVEFSPARHSCIGAFTRAISGKTGTVYNFQTVDILTGETLYDQPCADNASSGIYCGNGHDVDLIEKRDKALERALVEK